MRTIVEMKFLIIVFSCNLVINYGLINFRLSQLFKLVFQPNLSMFRSNQRKIREKCSIFFCKILHELVKINKILMKICAI